MHAMAGTKWTLVAMGLAAMALYGCSGAAAPTPEEDTPAPPPRTADVMPEEGTSSPLTGGVAGERDEGTSPTPPGAGAVTPTPDDAVADVVPSDEEPDGPMTAEDQTAPVVGNDVSDSAPGFTLPSATGPEVSLVDFRGEESVVLVFYRAFW